MENPYFENMDRATRRHVDSMRSRGQYYGFLFTTVSEDISATVREDIQRMIGGTAQVHRTGANVFFAGPLSTKSVDKIRAYAQRSGGVQSTKALRGPYEFFPVTPEHLLERIVEYSN